MEPEAEESKAHEAGKSPEEETREGSEPEEAPRGSRTNRKRSAKNANNTKAPMDGESCGCGGDKAKKCTCDGGCGGYGKKMDRNDALTPQEYLAACDLGIQGRSRSYIRSRLDAAERLDLKCGNGSISEGEKCTKGAATKAELTSKKNQKLRSNLVKAAALGVGAAGAAVLVNNAIRSNAAHKRINTRTLKGLKDLKAKGNHSLVAAVRSAKYMNEQFPGPLTEQQGYFSVMNAKVTRGIAREGVREGLAKLKKRVPMSPARRRAAARGRRDSVYAAGFSPELDQLAI